ncbi:uncharacterized protein BJ212DRAFT_1580954 [Suillus subaureus]|uniref:Uncharacterized protein n=1 Tax=Suillus subaureus TaxID=48587 RepID=A0A9P7DWA3_9AGAM|nr:uncharacterized protein BJ212DRAFT_1580954 [Suillus subaureus]KAG1804493.1 hypothetical protein BJ212DRAFT_1580954 [Suillus subaureus]
MTCLVQREKSARDKLVQNPNGFYTLSPSRRQRLLTVSSIERWPTKITTAAVSNNNTTHPKVHRQDRGVTILNNPNNRTEASLMVNLTADLGTNLNRHHRQFMYNNPLSPVVLVEVLAAWLVLLVHVFAAVLRRHFVTVYCKIWELHRRLLSAGTCNIA